MTEKELNVRQAEIRLEENQGKLREAETALRIGQRKATAELAKFQAEQDQILATLHAKIKEASQDVERARAYLAHYQSLQERGFDTN